MARFICWHIQEQTHGGVDANTAKLLDGLARGDKPGADRRLKPGTVLVREYQGDRHTVTVVPSGYVWRDATYASLSAIACNITGTAWNGPRFFGLRAGGNCPEDIEGEPAGSHAGIAAVLDDCIVAASPLPAQRCNDEANRTQDLSLRDLHPQIDRA
jgi:hypothetical protein